MSGLFAVLMLQVLPASVMVTPLFVAFNQVGLLNWPRTAVILGAAAKAMPFFVVLVRATFLPVPRELEEAALVDGNSRLGAFFNIVLPLARNGVLVCAILTFMSAFGEYIYSKSIIQDRRPINPPRVGLQSFLGPNSKDWNSIMAYSAIYVTPILAHLCPVATPHRLWPDFGSAEMTTQIDLSGIDKHYGGYHALTRGEPDHPQGQLRGAGRPVGLRQVDLAAHHRRAGDHHRPARSTSRAKTSPPRRPACATSPWCSSPMRFTRT